MLIELADFGFVAKRARVSALVCDSVGLFVVALVWAVISDVSLV